MNRSHSIVHNLLMKILDLIILIPCMAMGRSTFELILMLFLIRYILKSRVHCSLVVLRTVLKNEHYKKHVQKTCTKNMLVIYQFVNRDTGHSLYYIL